jgi:hypothetical protein
LFTAKQTTLKHLEVLIAKDKSGEKWVKKWRDDLREIRYFSVECLYQIWFAMLDSQVMKMVHEARKLGPSSLQSKNLEKSFDFKKLNIYSEDFAQSFQDVFLGYLLSLNQILNETVYDNKTEKLAGYITKLYANFSDAFMQGLLILDDEQIEQLYVESEHYEGLYREVDARVESLFNISCSKENYYENIQVLGDDFERTVRYNFFLL